MSSTMVGLAPGRPHIAVADDDAQARRLLTSWFEHAGYDVTAYPTGDALLEDLDRAAPDAVCTDVQMPGRSGIDLLEVLRQRRPELPVVVFSGAEGVETAVECMRLGALDFLVKPLDHGRLFEHLRPVLERDVVPRVPGMIGTSPAMAELFSQIQRVADAKISVLIRGESGTGKELVARAIHLLGRRANDPFIALNCGAIPETLQESELFGHEKGAFTGATGSRAGKFERAGTGTVFLDEVAELSASAQVRLLRVLQERRVERVGGAREVELDARVISASHKRLDSLVADRLFREDLYYRLAVYPIDVPTLRERKEDIPALVRHFMHKHADDVGRQLTEVEPRFMRHLELHDWPGNVRELENIVYGAMIRARHCVLDVETLPPMFRDASGPPRIVARSNHTRPKGGSPASNSAGPDHAIVPLDELQRRAILDALDSCDHNVSQAARKLGIGRATMYRRMDRFGIRRAA